MRDNRIGVAVALSTLVWPAVIDPAPRSTTATVKSDAVIITMDQARFMFMIRQTPFFSIQSATSNVQTKRPKI